MSEPTNEIFWSKHKTPNFSKGRFGGIEDGYKSLFKIGFINIVNTKIFDFKMTICQLFPTFFCKNRPNWRNYPQMKICKNHEILEPKMASSCVRFGKKNIPILIKPILQNIDFRPQYPQKRPFEKLGFLRFDQKISFVGSDNFEIFLRKT